MSKEKSFTVKFSAFILALAICFGAVFIASPVKSEAMTPAQIKESLDNLMTNDGYRPGRPGFITGSGICYAFLNNVVNKLFGYSLPTQQSNKYSMIVNNHWQRVGDTLCNNNGNLSPETMRQLFMQAQPGDIVQMHYSYGNYGYHTALVYSVSEEGVVLYHAGSGTVHFGAGPIKATGSLMWGTKGEVLKYEDYYNVYLKGSADGLSIYRSTHAASASVPNIPKVNIVGDTTYTSVNPDDYMVPTVSIMVKNPSIEGTDVAWIQAVLFQLGYEITIDGKYGNQSGNTVKNFQRDVGITVDGQVGPQTRSKLQEWWNTFKTTGKTPVKTTPVPSPTPGVTTSPSPSPSPSPAPTPSTGTIGGYEMPTVSIRLTSPTTKGDGVKWIQKVLKDLGFSITIDGEFGEITCKRVKEFQSLCGLTPDGSVGPATRTAMLDMWNKKMGAVSPSPTPRPTASPTPRPSPSPTPAPTPLSGRVGNYDMPTVSIKLTSPTTRSDGVKWVQTILKDLGYGGTVDGEYGSNTQKRVKQFQQEHGLTVDGNVGPATRTIMYEAWIKHQTPSPSPSPTPRPSPSPTPRPSPTPTPNTNGNDSDNPDDHEIPSVSIYYTTPRMTGDGVKWIQCILAKLGYDVTPDGSFGPASYRAVIKFQTDNGLSVDGSVGPTTRAKLQAKWEAYKESLKPKNPYPEPTESIKLTTPRMTGDGVKWVQTILKELGYNVSVDGSFGPASQQAVKDFQKANNLYVDGNVGPATRAKLTECWKKKVG